MSTKDARKMAKLFEKRQPAVVSYLLTVDSDVLNEDERQLLFYLGTAIWQMMSQGKTPLSRVTIDMLEEAEDRNVKMAEYLTGETESGFAAATKTVVGGYRQGEVLRYAVEALMEEPESECVVRDKNLGIMFLDLKTVIDSLDTETIPPCPGR